jgi:diacylglycerol kinase (ATP)
MMGPTMVRKPPTRSSLGIVVGLFVGFVGWTLLTFYWPPMARLDALLAPPLDPTSRSAQIASAFALLTWPGLEYAALAGIAFWAYRRRLRRLTVALLLTVGLAWGLGTGLKFLFARERPAHHLDVLTASGYAYPSGHMVGVTASVIAVGATFAVTRKSVRARLAWQFGGIALVLAVAFDSWFLGANYISDLVGGALLGSFVACFSLVVAGVTVPAPADLVQEIAFRPKRVSRRCAVIFNPIKVGDEVTFRRHVEWELQARGWDKAIWYETTPEDPGHAMTAAAVAAEVDLVIGAGGDGTVRVICNELAGTGVPFGLIPAGTGNLLARNMGIPLDEAAALDVAFEGNDRAIDLIRISVDGGPPEHFGVMAGVGLDAAIMEGTNPELKKAVGSAAYFVSAAQHANHPALQATVQIDNYPAIRRKAHLILVGNVGVVTGNIQLFPQAVADDGLLDVLVASPRTARDWARMVGEVVSRRHRDDELLDRLTGHRVTISVDRPDSYQVDGDQLGSCQSMVAEIVPGAISLRVPRPGRKVKSSYELASRSLESQELASA